MLSFEGAQIQGVNGIIEKLAVSFIILNILIILFSLFVQLFKNYIKL